MTDTDREDADASKTGQDDGPMGSLKRRYRAWRASIKRRPKLNRAYRIGVGIVGGAIVIGGLGLIPLPGPGWVIVFLGLAILATEFVWADRTQKFARDRVTAWTAWMGRQPIVVHALVGLLTFAFVLGVLYLLFRLTGVPSWVPDSWANTIPGLSA